MKGILYAALGGACITLQGIANAKISTDVGTWQAATITQLTGFILALFILMLIRDRSWKELKNVKPLYITGGAMGAIIIFSEVSAIQQVGVTLTISALLIAQLSLTYLVDTNGWFGVMKRKITLPGLIGIAMMISGVIILKL
ncbi:MULTISPECIES: DMT family transporter [unclassified Paenibacillus]|uniref:DMT family transporter n=1 Tax=Paenibacillus provencensis TaxID=441151 RepID=A0ABW3PMI4_9BACL|nr:MULTISPECIES: DMT family transporter [unclassified Paenibacillus]MCM3126776.1 DMT family transporter [Paenibacillus sp. MER 78]SFS57916.1 transporter family-2 protein [Paenibacillus sp. 453mf]